MIWRGVTGEENQNDLLQLLYALRGAGVNSPRSPVSVLSTVFSTYSPTNPNIARRFGRHIRLCDIKGCYEYGIRDSYDIGMNYLNRMKPLEYALPEGRDGVSGVTGGLSCPAPSENKTFDEFFVEYKHQPVYIINQTIEGTSTRRKPLKALTFP